MYSIMHVAPPTHLIKLRKQVRSTCTWNWRDKRYLDMDQDPTAPPPPYNLPASQPQGGPGQPVMAAPGQPFMMGGQPVMAAPGQPMMMAPGQPVMAVPGQPIVMQGVGSGLPATAAPGSVAFYPNSAAPIIMVCIIIKYTA